MELFYNSDSSESESDSNSESKNENDSSPRRMPALVRQSSSSSSSSCYERKRVHYNQYDPEWATNIMGSQTLK